MASNWVECRRSPKNKKIAPPKKGVYPEQFKKYKPRSQAWLSILHPIDSDILMKWLDDYFKKIEDRNIEHETTPFLFKRPTISGVCRVLKISPTTLRDYVNKNNEKLKNNPQILSKLQDVMLTIMDAHEQNLFKSNCTWNIFMLKSVFWIKEPPVEKAPDTTTTINNFNIILLHKKAEGTLSDTVIKWAVS